MQIINQKITDNYSIYNGDSCEVIKEIPDNSIHYSIYSPPFKDLYVYSNSERDMGNCRTEGEFYEHFKFLIKELHRVTMPGRLTSFHCMNLPTSKTRDGYIGISDFRGDLIRLFQECGWIYHSEVCIWKDPVIAMQRTKALGLLHKQIKKDAAMCRQGIPDYLVTMRKLGDNPERVTNTNESFPVDVWQQIASPIWDTDGRYLQLSEVEAYPEPVWEDINPSNTLQKQSAREEKDEKHICPLQLDVIERAIKLWTNPNDIVLSPFMGIGSEIFQAVKMGRRGVGIELKPSYYEQSVRNLINADLSKTQMKLF